MMERFVGLAPGQPFEHTAIAVVEWDEKDDFFRVCHLERFGERPYAQSIDRLRQLGSQPGWDSQKVCVDVTAAGNLFVERMVEARVGGSIDSIVVVSGDPEPGKRWCQVSRRDLITGIAILLQDRRLKIREDLIEAPVLAAQMREFRPEAPVSDAWGRLNAPEHNREDLVRALAIACWRVQRSVNSRNELRDYREAHGLKPMTN